MSRHLEPLPSPGAAFFFLTLVTLASGLSPCPTRLRLPVRPGYNWHTVHGLVSLLVRPAWCERCRMHQGNMREINREKFRCRTCGGTEVRAYLPTTRIRWTCSWRVIRSARFGRRFDVTCKRKPPVFCGGFQRSRLGGRLARPAGMGIGTTVVSTRTGHAGFSKI